MGKKGGCVLRAQTAEESERELGEGERRMGKGDPEIVAFGPIFGSALPFPLFPPSATVIPPRLFSSYLLPPGSISTGV